MKRFVSAIFSLIICFVIILGVSCNVFSEVDPGESAIYSGTLNNGKITWTVSDNKLTISGEGKIDNFNGLNSDNTAPWHPLASEISSIEISSGVTGIGEFAFSSFINLKTVYIPETISTIGQFSFYNCTGLNGVSIPVGVSVIDDGAFKFCKNISNLTIPSSVTYIGSEAFSGCDNLIQIVFESNMEPKYVTDNVFQDVHAKCTVPLNSKWTDSDFSERLSSLDCYYNCSSATGIRVIDSSMTINAGCTIPYQDISFALTYGNAATEKIIRAGRVYGIEFDEIDSSTPGLQKITFRLGNLSANIPVCIHNSDGSHCYAVAEENPASCVDGYRKYICPCGAEKTEELPATDSHKEIESFVAATTEKSGAIGIICENCKEVLSETKIIPQIATIKLSATAFTYDGRFHVPTVTITDSEGNVLKEGTDYLFAFPKSAQKVGIYKVFISGTEDGLYSLSETLTFKINPVKTAISKLTAGSKSFRVTWSKKTNEVTGYQIQYSLKKDFSSSAKTVTIGSYKTTAKTIKKLKAAKTYYVRIRTYKTANGTKCYSSWSSVKHIKTKK